MSTPATVAGYTTGAVLIAAAFLLLRATVRPAKTSTRGPSPTPTRRFTPGRVAVVGAPAATPAGRVTGRAPVTPRLVPGPQTSPASVSVRGQAGSAASVLHAADPGKWTARVVMDDAGLKGTTPRSGVPHEAV